MFKKNRNHESPSAHAPPLADLERHAREEAERKKWNDVIEGLARESGESLIPQMDEIEATHARMLQKDREAFEFSCERYGDTLSMKVQRIQTRYEDSAYVNKPEKSVFAVNVGRGAVIRFDCGDDAGRLGVAKFNIGLERINKDSNSFVLGWSGMGSVAPPKDHRYIVTPEYATYRLGENPVFIDHKTLCNNGSNVCYSTYSESYWVQHVVKNFPKPAQDDEIVFRGSGTLYVPHGMGEGVYAQIMQALKDGYEPEA